ncbi:MAG: OmpP1/FadL family transporter, partial [Alphaproteobacteria bacterium]
PESITIGASQNLTSNFQILSDITWTRWSRLKSLRVTTNNPLLDSNSKYNWNNSVLYSIGSNYKIGSKDIFRFGLAYEKDAVNDRNREPTVPNGDKYWVTAGINHKFENNLQLDFTYAYQKYKANNIYINEIGNNQGTLNGKYKLRADVISLALRKQF